MEGSPGILHHHLDALDFDSDGGLLLSASSLTRRYWVGSVFYFKDPEKAPDVDGCSAMTQLDAGVSDVKALAATNKFIFCTDTGSVQLWETQTDENTKQCTLVCVAEPIEHDSFVTSLSLSADRTRVISSSQDCRVKIWDLEEFVSTHTFKGHSDTVNMVSCHLTNPHVFASCSQDGSMLLWDTRNSKPASHIESQFLPSNPTCLCWRPDSEHSIAIGTETGSVLLQDIRNGVGVAEVTRPHKRAVNRLRFSPQSSDCLASVSDDSTAALIMYEGDKVSKTMREIQMHKDFVKGVAWQPNSNRLFTCGWDTKVKVTVVETADSPTVNTDTISQPIKTDKIEQMEVLEGASVET